MNVSWYTGEQSRTSCPVDHGQKESIELRSLTYPPSKASTLRSVNKGGGGGEHTVAGLGRLCEQIQTYIFSQLCTHARMHAHARTRACMTQKRHGLSSAV